MPLNVQLANAQVKDPQSGQMIPAGLIGSDAISTINTAKNQAVAAVQQKGVETLESIPDDYTALTDEVDELKTQLTDVHNILYVESDNLYNPALQTPSTISPHYYINGVPGENPSLDANYNCTAPIDVEPNTQYTVAIVPIWKNMTKPWHNAKQGVFFYKSDGTYISNWYESNTFSTPAETAFIKFNYYIHGGADITLDLLNERCMLIEGGTVPTTYTPYYSITLDERVEKLEEAPISKKPIWYKRTGTTIEVGYSYDDTKNIIITMMQFGGNNLFDFKKIETIAKTDNYETGTRTTIFESGTDCFAPYQVGAVNNIDGDDKTGDVYNITFTGGNHQYNNSSSGSTPTARINQIIFLADNSIVTDGDKGYCNKLKIKWENRVQGYNTKKADGTGREIIKVLHSAIFDGNDIKVSTDIYPLEDVTMIRFYGFQIPIESTFPKYRFLDSQNRLLTTFVSGAVSNSGDADGYTFFAEDSDNVNSVEISINPLFDLGRRKYISTNPAMFVSGSGKFYFNIVRGTDLSMSNGSLYGLKGAYDFKPVLLS